MGPVKALPLRIKLFFKNPGGKVLTAIKLKGGGAVMALMALSFKKIGTAIKKKLFISPSRRGRCKSYGTPPDMMNIVKVPLLH